MFNPVNDLDFKEVMKRMKGVMQYNRWESSSLEPFWKDTELQQPDFAMLFAQLEKTNDLEFRNVLYRLCAEDLALCKKNNTNTNIQALASLCEKARNAYSLKLKSNYLIKDLIANLPGSTAKAYYKLNSYFPNNSVCITEIKYDNKTFYIWVYRYAGWEQDDKTGTYHRKYCVLKEYFYQLFLSHMDQLPDGYHIFCPYTRTATDNKNLVHDIIIWETMKRIRINRIIDIINQKLLYAKWDTTFRKMYPGSSELDLFLSETVSYMNKGLWRSYITQPQNA